MSDTPRSDAIRLQLGSARGALTREKACIHYDEVMRQVEDMERALSDVTQERDTHKKSLDMLYGEKFSDRCYHALKSRAERGEEYAGLTRDLLREVFTRFAPKETVSGGLCGWCSTYKMQHLDGCIVPRIDAALAASPKDQATRGVAELVDVRPNSGGSREPVAGRRSDPKLGPVSGDASDIAGSNPAAPPSSFPSGEWIRTSDRLPEPGQLIAVHYISDGDYYDAFHFARDETAPHDCDYDRWMPLPAYASGEGIPK